MRVPSWMNREILLISLSAFFADLGYQAAIAIFPIFIVVALSASASEYGIASAVAFGIGSFFGYLGGLLSDRYENRYIAIFGNALIPLISLMALTNSILIAVMLFSGGWWARNFRSPARRSMVAVNSTKKNRSSVFGFLHVLDIGGGMLSVVGLLALLYLGLSIKSILLLTAIPLIISTLLLIFAKNTMHKKQQLLLSSSKPLESRASIGAYRGIIIATALYGFSTYSFGFPILTIAKQTSSFIGIGSYAVYLGISAFAGYWIGSKRYNKIKSLSYMGYALSGFGSLLLGLSYAYGLGAVWSYIAVGILGFAFGIIETLEPTLISFIKNVKELGKGMGSLSGSRSFGIFTANLVMGVLYVVNPFYSYIYATTVSIIAGIIVLMMSREFVN